MFALSTASLAVVLCLAYVLFVILQAVCVLCVGTYAAVIGLFLVSGAAAREPYDQSARSCNPVTSRPLVRTPSARVGRGGVRDRRRRLHRPGFPGTQARAAVAEAGDAPPQAAAQAPAASSALSIRQLEEDPAQQPRMPADGAGRGRDGGHSEVQRLPVPGVRHDAYPGQAAFAKWQKQAQPGEVRLARRTTRSTRSATVRAGQSMHPAACDAAVAVRLTRAKGKREAMEEWIYSTTSRR